MSPLICLQIVYKGKNGFAAEGSHRHTAQSNLLASLPQREWTVLPHVSRESSGWGWWERASDTCVQVH